MTTAEHLRWVALSLPETEESTHFKLPAFKVHGKVFVVIEKDQTSAISAPDQRLR